MFNKKSIQLLFSYLFEFRPFFFQPSFFAAFFSCFYPLKNQQSVMLMVNTLGLPYE